jgi:hypothetical protein
VYVNAHLPAYYVLWFVLQIGTYIITSHPIPSQLLLSYAATTTLGPMTRHNPLFTTAYLHCLRGKRKSGVRLDFIIIDFLGLARELDLVLLALSND